MNKIRVLIIEDDQEDFLIAKHYLIKNQQSNYHIDWEPSYEKALGRIIEQDHDVYIIDYNLGEHTGTNLVKQVINSGVNVPFIFLTGMNKHSIDMEALEVGAVDYLLKNRLNEENLERSIRYAIKQKETENRLIESNATKDKLFSIISHDLRAPLGTIMSYLDFLAKEKEPISEDIRVHIISELSSMSKSTYNLLDNLLFWARSQLGSFQLDQQILSVYAICMDTIDLLKESANKKGIELRIDIPKDLLVYCDSNCLQLAFRNLISNAIKFTHMGGYIDLKQVPNTQHCTILVEDNGRGMDSETAAKALSGLKYFSTTGTEKESGSGLGLKITKEFIERNNGQIWIESELNTGTRVYFSLPYPKQD